MLFDLEICTPHSTHIPPSHTIFLRSIREPPMPRVVSLSSCSSSPAGVGAGGPSDLARGNQLVALVELQEKGFYSCLHKLWSIGIFKHPTKGLKLVHTCTSSCFFRFCPPLPPAFGVAWVADIAMPFLSSLASKTKSKCCLDQKPVRRGEVRRPRELRRGGISFQANKECQCI